MGERKGVNKYYPPDWTPKMGSLNKYHGTHALRERARKLGQGILIIRFEMPYNIWCDGCGNHIGMGVRYNAEKKKVGMYYTTPIYQFRMKCHLCDNHFEIKTDPQNYDYVIISGARRQERRWDPTQNEQVAPEDKETSKQLLTDAMFRLEHGTDDQQKSKAVAPAIMKLEVLQDRWRDNYTSNKVLRHQFRMKKKETTDRANVDQHLLKKSSLNIALVAEDPDDKRIASLMKYTAIESCEDRQKLKRNEIETRPIFTSPEMSPSMPACSRMDSISEQSSVLKDIAKSVLKKKIQLIATSSSLTPTKVGIIRKDTCRLQQPGPHSSVDFQEMCERSDESSIEKNVTDEQILKPRLSLVTYEVLSSDSESSNQEQTI